MMRDLPASEVTGTDGALSVGTLGPDDLGGEQRWEAFVAACPEATFFHRAGWQRIIREVFRHRTWYLYGERNGLIEGVLPLAQVKSRLFGHSLVSLPFGVYGGVAATNPEAAVRLEARAQELAHELGVDHLEFRNLRPRHAGWPAQELYVTFRKEILPDVEANMLAIPRKQRAMVRKGVKNELVSVIDERPYRFFALYADNVHRHGTPPYSLRYFEALQREFGHDCEILTVEDKAGNTLSSVVSFYFRDEVLPYYAGDDVAARDLAANDFKYWELMRRACERGVKLFDYGRSKRDTGPYSFKKNWGFEPQPLHYEYCLYKRDSIPQNNPMNPKFRAVIAAWRKLPIAVANALGPHIVRYLG
jgi:FemAB-related protein (PEP-CTERM system-associated)